MKGEAIGTTVLLRKQEPRDTGAAARNSGLLLPQEHDGGKRYRRPATTAALAVALAVEPEPDPELEHAVIARVSPAITARGMLRRIVVCSSVEDVPSADGTPADDGLMAGTLTRL